MNDSILGWFFGVVIRPRTWTNMLFQWLAFPLGLFYFIFLITGLSVGLGLVIVWVGIPILLVVAGAWWLFGAFERVQARYLLGADVPPPPRPWESANGVWGKLKAYFGSASTWLDLLYLLAKLAFGIVAFTLLVTLAGILFWLVYLPVAHFWSIPFVDFGNGRAWTPPLWLALVAIPGAILNVFLSLHIVNGWGWVCARWAELLFRATSPAPSLPATAAPPAPAPAALAPVVSVPAPPPRPPAPPEAPVPLEPATPAPQPVPTAQERPASAADIATRGADSAPGPETT